MSLFKDGQLVGLNRDIVGLKKGQQARVIKTLNGEAMSLFMARKHGLVVTIKGKGETRLKKIVVKLINPPSHLRNKPELTLNESVFS